MALRLIGSVNSADKIWGIQEYMKAIEEGKKYPAGYKLMGELSKTDWEFDSVIAPKDYMNGAALFDSQPGVNAETIWGYISKSTNLDGILSEEGKNSKLPKLKRPLIFWNPKMTLAIIGDQKGLKSDSLDVEPAVTGNAGKGMFVRAKKGVMKGAPNIIKRVVVYTRTELPAWLVLYHELGHIRQSFEKGGAANMIAYSMDTVGMEKDNAVRVEHPLCEQARLPKRDTYLHLEMSIPFTGNFNQTVIQASKPDFQLLYVAKDSIDRKAIDKKMLEEANLNKGKDPKVTPGLFYNIL